MITYSTVHSVRAPLAQRLLQSAGRARGALAALLIFTALASPVWAGELRVAVAANFAAPMKALAPQFERETGIRLSLSYGATGQFYAQIRNGAPFTVLVAADEEVPQKLEAQGLTVPGTRLTYATGRLALWSAQAGLIDAQASLLKKPLPGKLALANPKLSPYGRASAEVLAALGVQVAGQTVEAAHIGQAYQYVASGNAALGFVALSQIQGREGSAWIVPQSLHAPIRQQAVLLRTGDAQRGARLLEFLRSAPARAVIASYGYEP